MNITDKRERISHHLAEAYNAEELAEMLVNTYTDLEVQDQYELWGED